MVEVPIRNVWSLEPGECIVAEEIMERLKCEVYFPVRDVGLDLLIVKGDKHVGIQVKESRYYISRTSLNFQPSLSFAYTLTNLPGHATT